MVSIQVGDGVPADSIGYALDNLRALCRAYSLDSLRVWLRRTGHPSMPTFVLADAVAVTGGRMIRTRAVQASAWAAVDVARGRLTTMFREQYCAV